MNEQKFQNIYHLTYPKISRYVVSKCRNIEDVKDILQNIYIDVYKKIDKIDFIENEAYLYTLTKNNLDKSIFLDGIHLNSLGNNLILEEILRVLKL